MPLDPTAAEHQPQLVQQFLQNVRGAVPLTIEQIEMLLRLLAAARDRVETFLDLGCGDGVLSAAILDEYPEAHGVLLDFSEQMLDAARRQLHQHTGKVTSVNASFEEPEWVQRVAHLAPFDAVVSAFAIHHCPDQRKRGLYAEVFGLLKPDGIFINIEHVASATRWTESVWEDYMISAIFGEQLKNAEGKSRAEVAREYYERASKEPNALAPLEVQLDWLRDIGFDNVECYLKVLELAMFGGQRGGGKELREA